MARFLMSGVDTSLIPKSNHAIGGIKMLKKKKKKVRKCLRIVMSFKSWREQRQSLFYFHRLEVCRRLIMLQSCILKSQSCQFLNSCQSARTDAKQRKLSRRQSAAMATGLTTFEFKYGREDIRCFFFKILSPNPLLGVALLVVFMLRTAYLSLEVFALNFL